MIPLRSTICISLLLPGCFGSVGCATIVSDKYYPVTINSLPTAADLEVRDESGAIEFTGQTPAVVRLAAGEAYFDKEKYTLKFTKENYKIHEKTIEASIDPWYWGNFVIGGLIGMLIVDPISGSMFEIDETSYTATLEPTAGLPSSPSKLEPLGSSDSSNDEQKKVLEKDASKVQPHDDAALVDWLRKLREARDAGLITEQEYKLKKAAKLREM